MLPPSRFPLALSKKKKRVGKALTSWTCLLRLLSLLSQLRRHSGLRYDAMPALLLVICGLGDVSNCTHSSSVRFLMWHQAPNSGVVNRFIYHAMYRARAKAQLHETHSITHTEKSCLVRKSKHFVHSVAASTAAHKLTSEQMTQQLCA